MTLETHRFRNDTQTRKHLMVPDVFQYPAKGLEQLVNSSKPTNAGLAFGSAYSVLPLIAFCAGGNKVLKRILTTLILGHDMIYMKGYIGSAPTAVLAGETITFQDGKALRRSTHIDVVVGHLTPLRTILLGVLISLKWSTTQKAVPNLRRMMESVLLSASHLSAFRRTPFCSQPTCKSSSALLADFGCVP